MSYSNLLLLAPFLSLLTACDHPTDQSYQGYIEGEYVYLAAPLSGYLGTLNIARGSHVDANALAFNISAEQEQQGLNEMESRAIAALEHLHNLSESRRPQEIAVMEAQLHSAGASFRLSDTQLKQQEALAAKGFVSSARLDEVRATYARDAAQLDSARQQLAIYRNSIGRWPELRGAEAEMRATQAQVAQKRWQVDKKKVLIPAPGEISETYYRIGEWVPAGQPVVSLLPDGKRLVRFYVPETRLASLHMGQAIHASCDGCVAPITATINFISSQAEYTPPVIYSQGSREKLVFRVEAVPAAKDATHLRPGLPVEVKLN